MYWRKSRTSRNPNKIPQYRKNTATLQFDFRIAVWATLDTETASTREVLAGSEGGYRLMPPP